MREGEREGGKGRTGKEREGEEGGGRLKKLEGEWKT